MSACHQLSAGNTGHPATGAAGALRLGRGPHPAQLAAHAPSAIARANAPSRVTGARRATPPPRRRRSASPMPDTTVITTGASHLGPRSANNFPISATPSLRRRRAAARSPCHLILTTLRPSVQAFSDHLSRTVDRICEDRTAACPRSTVSGGTGHGHGTSARRDEDTDHGQRAPATSRRGRRPSTSVCSGSWSTLHRARQHPVQHRRHRRARPDRQRQRRGRAAARLRRLGAGRCLARAPSTPSRARRPATGTGSSTRPSAASASGPTVARTAGRSRSARPSLPSTATTGRSPRSAISPSPTTSPSAS